MSLVNCLCVEGAETESESCGAGKEGCVWLGRFFHFCCCLHSLFFSWNLVTFNCVLWLFTKTLLFIVRHSCYKMMTIFSTTSILSGTV